MQVDDLNLVIKYFAAHIGTKILDLQNAYRPYHTHQNHNNHQSNSHENDNTKDNSNEQMDQIVEKYRSYILQDEQDVEYVRKFNHRIIQIFGFYKWKSKNQSILSHAERQIVNKLNILLNTPKLSLSIPLAYVIGIIRKGFTSKAPINDKHTIRKSKQREKESGEEEEQKYSTPLSSCINKININFMKQKRKQKQKQKQSDPKAGGNSKPAKQLALHMAESHPRKKRAVSVMSTPCSKPLPCLHSLGNIYNCLDIDKAYLQKFIEHASIDNHWQREQLRRNRSTLKKTGQLHNRLGSVQHSHRKLKTEQNKQTYDRAILQEINNTGMGNMFNSIKCMGEDREVKKAMVFGHDREVKKAPLMVFGQKHRKIRTTGSHKRRQYQSQNLDGVIHNQNSISGI